MKEKEIIILLNKEIQSLKQELEIKNSQLENYKNEYKSSEEVLLLQNEEIQTQKETLEEKNEQIGKANKRLQRNEKILSQAYLDIKEKEQELKDQNEELSAIEEELRQQNEELQTQREAVEEKQQQVEKTNNRLQRNEKILVQAYKDIKEKEEELKDRNEELVSIEEELRQQNEEIQLQREALEDKNQQVEKANKRLQRNEIILSQAYIDIKEKEQELQERNEELTASEEELKQQNEEILTQQEKLFELNRELEKLSFVADKTDNAVLIFDSKGNFEWANEGFERMFGCTLDEHIEIKGKNIFEASTSSDITAIYNKCIKTQKSVLYESKAVHTSGEETWLQTTLTPIIDGYGEVSQLVAIDSDISKIKKVEQEVRLKNDQIKGSIKYAQTIQQVILPNIKNITEFDSFIIYRAKDIVSGDFYWYTKTDDYTFVAVVDCTGHGVPGAFMSLIGSRILSEIIIRKRIYDPKQILTEMNNEVIKALRQKQTNNRDGMDVCLSRIEKNENKMNLIFSGAKRPLFVIKDNSKTIVLKGDRKTVGDPQVSIDAMFTNQEIVLSEGDLIYLTTDGLSDQNNYERKRFGRKKIINILEKNSHKPMSDQKRILENELDNWQLEEKQRDDIAIWGIKI